MVVIRALQLVLNDEDCVVCEVTSDKIQGEAADRMFRLIKFEVDAQRIGEVVGMIEKPRGEVSGFVLPHRSELNHLQSS